MLSLVRTRTRELDKVENKRIHPARRHVHRGLRFGSVHRSSHHQLRTDDRRGLALKMTLAAVSILVRLLQGGAGESPVLTIAMN